MDENAAHIMAGVLEDLLMIEDELEGRVNVARVLDGLVRSMYSTLESTNEADCNGREPANVVDGLFAIARAIDGLAEAIGHSPVTSPRDDVQHDS